MKQSKGYRLSVIGYREACCVAACLLFMSAFAQEDTILIQGRAIGDIEVTATRVQQTTLSHQVTNNEQLNRDNTGQNLPYLLSTTPGLQPTK